MINKEEHLSKEESLALITSMIQKAKSSYHESGTSILLWGSAVTIASLVSYLKAEFQFNIGFDIWLLVLAAIIPQIFISIKERKNKQFQSHTDIAVNAVWLVYAFTIFGLVIYQMIVPGAAAEIFKTEGWTLMKHYTDINKPDEIIAPFVPSFFSIYLLVFAFPTLINGIIKNFKPMIIGAFITYALFVLSCFTAFKYDMLSGAITAMVCWFIPGIILRKRYNRQKTVHV